MANNKGISPMKVAVAGAALAAGTYAAVKFAKKENREKAKKLFQKYSKRSSDIVRRIVNLTDKVTDSVENVNKIAKEEGSNIKREIKKV